MRLGTAGLLLFFFENRMAATHKRSEHAYRKSIHVVEKYETMKKKSIGREREMREREREWEKKRTSGMSVDGKLKNIIVQPAGN